MNGDLSVSPQKKSGRSFLILLLVLGGALAALCHQGFLPYHILFANDGPLGAMVDSSNRLPGTFAGHWGILYWLGGPVPSSSPAISVLLTTILPPEFFMKVFAPLTMLILGCGAWFFFRQLGFSSGACIIGGLGAGLNMHFFSNACWGLGTWNISAGMTFVSLGVLVSPWMRPLWVKSALAGLAAGMAVMEGFDSGAILSLYVGAFIVFLCLNQEATVTKGIFKSVWVGAVVMFFAFAIAASTLYTLVGTQIKGIAAVGESPAEQKAHWDFTTQWSIPKLETLRVFIPGVFGYRLQEFITETNKASSYWGKIAEDPRVEELESGNPKTRAATAANMGMPQQYQDVMASDNMKDRDQIVDQVKGQVQRRHTGSGEYAGVLVCLLAIFGLFNSWRTIGSPFSQMERRSVWFWACAALFSLFAAWGRHGFVYQIIYRLPYFGNIRNPMKFMHPLNISLIILSGYGLEALYRRYLRNPTPSIGGLSAYLRQWWRKTSGFDKKWVVGTLLAVGTSLLALLLLTSSRDDLIHYLEHNGFSTELAPQMAAFCIHEVMLFILFLGLSALVIVGILSGVWSGRRAGWAWAFLAVIMIFDLGHSDMPWIHYFDYQKKYRMNPMVDFLRHQPWEHRVVSRLSPMGPYDISGDNNLAALCHFWLENDFLYNDIESLEVDQWPRMPDLDRDYLGTFQRTGNDLSPPVRMWRLTNTRYILADARVLPALNQMAEPKNSFRPVMLMDIVTKPDTKQIENAGDLTVVTNDNGHIALMEFTAALPRAKLYSNWKTIDDKDTLTTLNSPEFDPTRTVLLATDTPVAETPAHPETDPGTVEITSYKSRDVKLHADAKTAAVLLLNDRTGDYWNVWVDGAPAKMLRCNYIMRGVFVPAGQHYIEFRYQPPLNWLYVSVAAFGVGLALIGYVVVIGRREQPDISAEVRKI